ncbi:Uncharacterised protein [Listeria innocua]|nr:Uncharacterised protein [Listeria innocua]
MMPLFKHEGTYFNYEIQGEGIPFFVSSWTR